MASPEGEVKILVIDDDPLVFAMLQGAMGIFEEEGLSWSIVAYAASKVEADNALKKGDELGFTHVLLDANLGNNNGEGLEVARQIITQFPHVCIIGISSNEQGEMDPTNRVAENSKYVDKYVGKNIVDRKIFRAAIKSTLIK